VFQVAVSCQLCVCVLLYSDLRVFHYYTRLAVFVSCIGNKGGEVTGDSRKVHKVELNVFTPHQISDSIKSMRWAGHVAYMGKKGNAYRVLVGKPEGKRPL